MGNGIDYNNAYFEVGYVNIYDSDTSRWISVVLFSDWLRDDNIVGT